MSECDAEISGGSGALWISIDIHVLQFKLVYMGAIVSTPAAQEPALGAPESIRVPPESTEATCLAQELTHVD